MKPDSVAAAAPDVARTLFSDRLPLAVQFTELLAGSGVTHGLIGPREVPRLWERHVLNCAVIHEAIPQDSNVIDVGSGAGLPGLALAIVRPDLRIHLVEPLLRRTTWLSAAIEQLGLTSVTVHRGRAEQFWGELSAPVVTARAVARLSVLARWCLPLVSAHGIMLAIKGAQAGQELEDDRAAIRALGGHSETIHQYGHGILTAPATVVRIEVGSSARAATSGRGRAKRGAKARRRTKDEQGAQTGSRGSSAAKARSTAINTNGASPPTGRKRSLPEGDTT